MTEAPEYQIHISARARRDLETPTTRDFRRIDVRILALAGNPRPPGSLKLKDLTYRIRIGDWRVIYLVDDRERVIVIERVLRREKDTYRSL